MNRSIDMQNILTRNNADTGENRVKMDSLPSEGVLGTDIVAYVNGTPGVIQCTTTTTVCLAASLSI